MGIAVFRAEPGKINGIRAWQKRRGGKTSERGHRTKDRGANSTGIPVAVQLAGIYAAIDGEEQRFANRYPGKEGDIGGENHLRVGDGKD